MQQDPQEQASSTGLNYLHFLVLPEIESLFVGNYLNLSKRIKPAKRRQLQPTNPTELI